MGDDEELPGVQEDGVYLDSQGESPVGDVLLAGDCETEAEHHAEVMDQELVAAPLPVVDHHVQGIVEEVPDGEADEDMAGVGEGPDQIVPHLRSLKYRVVCQLRVLSQDELTHLVETYRGPDPGY